MIRFHTDTHSSRNSLTCLRRARVTPASRCSSLGHRPDLQALLAFLCNDPTMYRFCCYAPYAGDLLIWKCRTGQLSLRELTFLFGRLERVFFSFLFPFFFYEQGVLSARADNEAFLLCFWFLFCFVLFLLLKAESWFWEWNRLGATITNERSRFCLGPVCWFNGKVTGSLFSPLLILFVFYTRSDALQFKRLLRDFCFCFVYLWFCFIFKEYTIYLLWKFLVEDSWFEFYSPDFTCCLFFFFCSQPLWRLF